MGKNKCLLIRTERGWMERGSESRIVVELWEITLERSNWGTKENKLTMSTDV